MILESIDELMKRALYNIKVIQNRQKVSMIIYTVIIVVYEPEDLILRLNDWLMKEKVHKFFPRWKGLFVVRQVSNNGNIEYDL